MQKYHFICLLPRKGEFQKKSIGSVAVAVTADHPEFMFRKKCMQLVEMLSNFTQSCRMLTFGIWL